MDQVTMPTAVGRLPTLMGVLSLALPAGKTVLQTTDYPME